LEKVLLLRRKIDEIDEKILLFLKERVELCKLIGNTKRNYGIPIRDHQRENEQFRNIVRKASELGLNPHEVRGVYKEIIAMCARAQGYNAKESHLG